MQRILCGEDITCAILATDHAPHTVSEKLQPEPNSLLVPSGLPGLDTATLLCYDFVQSGQMTPKRFNHLTARGPAQLLRLTQKGEISLVYDADLIVIANEPTEFRDELVESRCGWTPFHGQSVAASLKLVVARGQILLNRL